LDRCHTTGAHIRAVIKRLEGGEDGSVGGLGQEAEQLAVPFDEAAQDARDGKGPVAVGHGDEDVGGEIFGEEHGTLGLAAGAEISGAAGERQEVFPMTFGTADAGETSLKPPAIKKCLHRARYNGAERS